MKILVVDDQLGVRLLLSEALEDEGFTIETAANGKEALEKIEVMQPELILLDLKMPIMTGTEVLEQLNSKGIQKKVIMMTAYGEEDIQETIRYQGVCGYINKPFDLDEVKEKISRIYSDC